MPDKRITYITILQQSSSVLVVDIICIGHITSYLFFNVCHIIHIFVLVVDVVLIVDIMSYLARNVRPIFHIYSSIVNNWCIVSFPFCSLIFFLFPLSFVLLVLWVSMNWIIILSGYMCLLLSLQQKLVIFCFFKITWFFDFRVVLTCCINVLY